MIYDCKRARPGSLLSTCFSISGWVFVSRRHAKSAPQATKYCAASRTNLLGRNADVLDRMTAKQETGGDAYQLHLPGQLAAERKSRFNIELGTIEPRDK